MKKIVFGILINLAMFITFISCPTDSISVDNVYKYSYKFNAEFKIFDKPSGTKPANVVLAWLQDSSEEAETNFSIKNFSVKLNGSQILSKKDFNTKLEQESEGDIYKCFFYCLPENYSDSIKINDIFSVTIEAKADRKISNIPSIFLIDQTEPSYGYWRDIGNLTSKNIFVHDGEDDFVESYSTLPENLQTISFQNKNYKIDKAYEFNDKDTFDYEMYAPKWTASAEYIANDMDKTYWSIKENIIREVNKSTYIKDGILHMPEQHWIDENGTAHLRDSEVYGFNTSWFGNPIKYPYTHKKGLVEIKFKMPRVKGVSFALFEVLKSGHRTDAVETEINANGWAFIEVDYAEIKSKDNTIEPLGSMHIYNPTKDIYKTTDYYYNEETDYLKRIEVDDDWYNQWHIMQAVWEDFKMNIFYDGELFRTVVWPEEYGNPVGDFSFILRPEYCGWDSDLDWTDTKEHDFQIDYIRVYKEMKD